MKRSNFNTFTFGGVLQRKEARHCNWLVSETSERGSEV